MDLMGAAEVDKSLAKDPLVNVNSLHSGEIGIGVNNGGEGGIYLKIEDRVVGLQTSSDYTNWHYPILVRKLPKGTVVRLIAQ